MQFSLDWICSLIDRDFIVEVRDTIAENENWPLTAEESARILTDRGLTVDEVLPGADGSGAILDIDIPANRPDCLGHLGIAREIAAALGVPFAKPAEPSTGGSGPIAVKIEVPEDCPRFTASCVRGVQVAPSPDWVVKRLEACGLRSINNIVDASNLVMLETGQPVHFFDLATLTTGKIVVRSAAAGENFVTLDSQERALDERMVVVTDGSRSVALAGIMGGANTEISDTTQDVWVEAAHWNPLSIRRTARRLGMHTDASHRFERGVDPNAPLYAQALSATLLRDLAGGTPDESILDVCPGSFPEAELSLRLSELPRLLGYRPSDEESRIAMEALGLQPGPIENDTIRCRVPSWRVDLEREADLVEEVARHLGYDRIPSTAAGLEAIGFVDADPDDPFAASRRLEEGARDILAPLGFHEAYGYAMIERGEDSDFVATDAGENGLELTHPLSESLAVLRRSILPGLLRAADLNQRRGVTDVRLFELGRVFIGRGKEALPEEPVHAGIVWSGAAEPRHWSREADPVGISQLAGVVEATIRGIRPGAAIDRRALARPGFHPGFAAEWVAEDGRLLAWGGSLHPLHQEKFVEPIWAAEIDLTAVSRFPDVVPGFTSLPRVGRVHRDLALVVGPDTAYSAIEECLLEIDAPARCSVQVVDRYQGPPLEEGESSLTVRLELQPDLAALTEDKIEAFRTAAVAALQDRLGLKIRS